MAMRTFLAYTTDAEDVWFAQLNDGSLVVSKAEFSISTMGKTERSDVVSIDATTVKRLQAWLAGDNDPR